MPYRVTSSIYLTNKFKQLLKIANFFINNDIIYFIIMIETFGLHEAVLK